jgi:hypothetical protein
MTNLKTPVLNGTLDEVRKLNAFLKSQPLRAAQVSEFITLTENIKGLRTWLAYDENNVEKFTPHIITEVISDEDGTVISRSSDELNRFYCAKVESYIFTGRVEWLETTNAERERCKGYIYNEAGIPIDFDNAAIIHPEQYGK